MAAKKYQEMLEKTIAEYHERRKHLSAEEAGEAQEQTADEIIRNATDQALQIFHEMNNIDKAQAQILYKLSRVLGCSVEDLLENPMA